MFYILANKNHLKGKRAEKLNAVEKVFERAEKQTEVIFTDHHGHAKEITEELTGQQGEHCIIAMGGDGTLHDVLNGVSDFENFSLGVIPYGTGNDFAAAANIPDDCVKAAEIIAFKQPRYIDFIQLSSGLRSLNAVGLGIDVDVLKRAYSGTNSKKSKYLQALISSLIKFKGTNFTIKAEGREEKHFGFIAALGNGIQIGGGIKLFPEAKIDDGKLDLFYADYISKRKMLGAFIKLMRGKVNDIKEAHAVKCEEAEIYADEPYTIQAEGELYENIPIAARVVTGKLKFYLPD